MSPGASWAAQRPGQGSRTGRNGARILVVDGDVATVRLLAERLTGLGHTVECVSGGRDALRSVRAEVHPLH